jgi:hypothetical protein
MQETVYTIRYFDQIRKKTTRTRWKMTEAEAAEKFADTTWEIIEAAKETHTAGADMFSRSMAHLQGPGSR